MVGIESVLRGNRRRRRAGAAAPAAPPTTGAHEKAARSHFEPRAPTSATSNCAAAISKLEESLSYEPSVGAHLSIADCYEQVDLVAAWRELQQAADLAAIKSDPRASIAHDRAAALEPKLSLLHFVYASSPLSPPDRAGLEVRVDGALVKPLLLRHDTLATTPGTHDILVSLPHKKTWHGQVVARSAGTSAEVDVTVEDETASSPVEPTPMPIAAAASPPRPEVDSSSSGGTQRTAAFVAGGVGIAGLAAGAIFGVVALADLGNLRDACGGCVSRCVAPSGAASVTGTAGQRPHRGHEVSAVAFRRRRPRARRGRRPLRHGARRSPRRDRRLGRPRRGEPLGGRSLRVTGPTSARTRAPKLEVGEVAASSR